MKTAKLGAPGSPDIPPIPPTPHPARAPHVALALGPEIP
jgi:hypothetical protein